MMTTTKLRGRHRHDHHEAEATARRNLVTSAATVVPTNVSAYFPPQIVDDCPRIDYLDLMLTNPVAIRNPVAAADLLGKDILEERISLILVCTSTAGTTSQPRRMTLEEVETAASVFVDLYNFQAGFGCDGSERIAINATYFDDDVLLFVPAVGANTMTFNMTGLCDGCVDGVTGLARPSFFSPPSSSLPNGGRTRHRRLRLHLHRNLESMKLLHDVLSLRAECACEEDALLALPPTFQHVVELVQTFLMFSTDCTLESANVVVLGQENDGDDDEECTGDSDCDGVCFLCDDTGKCQERADCCDCGSCEICDSTGTCQSIANCCTDSDDCNGDCKKCRDGKCVLDTDDCCRSDSDCPDDEVCKTNSNECVECTASKDFNCRSDEVCDTSSNTCEECTRNSHCPSSEYCSDDKECVDCLRHSHCTPDYCSDEGECVECTKSSHCGVCEKCKGNRCEVDANCCSPPAIVCTGPGHGGGGEWCDANNRCVECDNNTGCTGGCFECDKGQCKKIKGCCINNNDCTDKNKPFCKLGPPSECIQCWKHLDCKDGEVCKDNKCQRP